MSYVDSITETYSFVDVEIVIRRVTADLIMIANSTGAWTEDFARKVGHDVELLAKKGYLKWVDVTLFSYGVEQKATRFEVNTAAGGLSMSRPGGVLWPRVSGPDLRVILGNTDDYTPLAAAMVADELELSWTATNTDTNHSSLKSGGGRDYASNAFGVQRKDFTK
jgi:glycine/D-amino acid oxidase-like deaminating enzyme